MSGKFMKKKQAKKRLWILIPVILSLALVCAAAVMLMLEQYNEPHLVPHRITRPSETVPNTTVAVADTAETVPTETVPVVLDEVKETRINLGAGMYITDVGKYTGIYMEDGSDEIVSGIMMIAVTNEGAADIQFADISLPVGDEIAQFSLTTLPAGSTVVLLEKNRMAYRDDTYTTAVAENVVLFDAPLDLCEDLLKIQTLDGAINVSNISGGDIAGDIVIYYKNSAADVYYGGITYRVRIEGGLKDGELKQIIASHFSGSGSAIMFITCGEG